MYCLVQEALTGNHMVMSAFHKYSQVMPLPAKCQSVFHRANRAVNMHFSVNTLTMTDAACCQICFTNECMNVLENIVKLFCSCFSLDTSSNKREHLLHSSSPLRC